MMDPHVHLVHERVGKYSICVIGAVIASGLLYLCLSFTKVGVANHTVYSGGLNADGVRRLATTRDFVSGKIRRFKTSKSFECIGPCSF
jgi:hypothetical protein